MWVVLYLLLVAGTSWILGCIGGTRISNSRLSELSKKAKLAASFPALIQPLMLALLWEMVPDKSVWVYIVMGSFLTTVALCAGIVYLWTKRPGNTPIAP